MSGGVKILRPDGSITVDGFGQGYPLTWTAGVRFFRIASNNKKINGRITTSKDLTLSTETSVLSLEPGIPDSQHVELIGENETGILSPE